MTHEEATIRAFTQPTQRQRFVAMLQDPKRRREFTSSLAHFNGLDPRFVRAIPKAYHDAASIGSLLKQAGASETCWIISENVTLDGREMDLHEALRQTRGYGMGTIISCLAGKLAYFENEDMRCLLANDS